MWLLSQDKVVCNKILYAIWQYVFAEKNKVLILIPFLSQLAFFFRPTV